MFWFITKNSDKVHMLQHAVQMLHLDQLVIQQGWQQQSKGEHNGLCGLNIPRVALDLVSTNKDMLMETIAAGTQKIIDTNEE